MVVIGSLYREKIIIFSYLIVLVLEISQIIYTKFTKIIILLSCKKPTKDVNVKPKVTKNERPYITANCDI